MNREWFLAITFTLAPLWWFNASFGTLLPRYGQLLFCMVAGVLALSWGARSVPVRNWWVVGFCFYFLVWVLFSNLYSMIVADPRLILAASEIRGTFIAFAVGVVWYVLVAGSENPKEFWYNVICVSALLQTAFAVPQLFGYWPEFDFLTWLLNGNASNVVNDNPVGTLENNNFLCGYLAISLPFFLRFPDKWWRPGWHYALPLLAVLLLKSRSSTAVIAASVAIGVWYGRWWLLAAGIAFGLFFFKFIDHHNFSDMAEESRLRAWLDTMKGYNTNWFGILFGNGPGSGQDRTIGMMHNEWLQGLFEFGAAGVVLMIGFVVTLYRKNRILLASFAAIALDMVGSYPLHLPPSAILIAVVLALMERERRAHARIYSADGRDD